MQAEQAIQYLTTYIESKPQHRFGLCWWLSLQAKGEAAWPQCDSEAYDLVEAYRRSVGDHQLYLPGDYGPTPERLELARQVLQALQTGQLVKEDETWSTSPTSKETP